MITYNNDNSFITESKKHIQAVEQLRRELQAEESLFSEMTSSTIPLHANEEGGEEREEKTQEDVDVEEEVNEADAIQVEQVLRNDRVSKKKQKKQVNPLLLKKRALSLQTQKMLKKFYQELQQSAQES